MLVTGFSANSINCLNGAWSRTFLGQETRYNDKEKLTILDAIRAETGNENVTYVEGTSYTTDINTDEAVKQASNVDYIIVCAGEIPATEKPSDINELPLPQVQQDLIQKLASTGKPVILILVEGRPRIIREIEPLTKGIIMAYLPGNEGGRAIAGVLFGDINPSGKLPYTYPKYTGNLLPYYHKRTDIRDVNWGFNGFNPQFQFGFGLGYAPFAYSDLKLSTHHLLKEDTLCISVEVTNKGNITGKETVECYIHIEAASVSPDAMRLIGFKKISLDPAKVQHVQFKLTRKELGFIGEDNQWVTEPGKFRVMVGGNPENLLNEDFEWKE